RRLSAVNDLVDRRRRVLVEIALGLCDIENAAIGTQAQRVSAARLTQRGEANVLRHSAIAAVPRGSAIRAQLSPRRRGIGEPGGGPEKRRSCESGRLEKAPAVLDHVFLPYLRFC